MEETLCCLSRKAIEEFDLPYIEKAVEEAGMTNVSIFQMLNRLVPDPPEDPKEQSELMQSLTLMILRENYKLIVKGYLN